MKQHRHAAKCVNYRNERMVGLDVLRAHGLSARPMWPAKMLTKIKKYAVARNSDWVEIDLP